MPQKSRRAVLVALVSLAAPVAMAQQSFQTFAKSELTVVAQGKPHRFTVELAVTAEQMAQGLMFRRSLAADAGMLFDYGHPQRVSFWMKNTLIPLDMIFIRADGTVAGVHERAVPLSLEPITFPEPVRAVLEVNGGTASRLGIRPGDQVKHRIFVGG